MNKEVKGPEGRKGSVGRRREGEDQEVQISHSSCSLPLKRYSEETSVLITPWRTSKIFRTLPVFMNEVNSGKSHNL